MINDDRADVPQPPRSDSLASLRGYLLFIAEQHLGKELHAKGGPSDLVQATLLAAHQAGDQYRGRTPEERRGWVRRILLNVLGKFRRHWRSQSRDCTHEVPLDHQAMAQVHLPHRESPSHSARQNEQRQLLAQAVAQLPDEQRSVIALHLDAGLSFVEIGQQLGKTADAARMVYNRALERLQTLIPSTLG